MAEDRSVFISEELSSRGVPYTRHREDFMVSCPWHTQKAWKKKLSIHKSGEMIHCWACNYKGNWNTYANRLGLTKIDFKKQLLPEIAPLEEDILSIERSEHGDIKPHGLMPWHGEWRGLPEKFLQAVPSYRWYDVLNQQKGYRIVWPIHINKRIVGHTSVSLENKTPPKYNFPGLKTRKYLFPFDHPIIQTSAVLVEGVFDALRLIYNDIPALCILGTTNWSKEKIPLLVTHGIKTISLAFDGDDAGHKVTTEVYNDLKDIFDVRIFDCPAGTDPGDIPDKYLKVIRRTLR